MAQDGEGRIASRRSWAISVQPTRWADSRPGLSPRPLAISSSRSARRAQDQRQGLRGSAPIPPKGDGGQLPLPGS